jgi:hypothetical protein
MAAATFVAAMRERNFPKACTVVSPRFWRTLQFRGGTQSDSCEVTLREVAPEAALGVARFDALLPKMHVISGSNVTYGNVTVALWERGGWRLDRSPGTLPN